jgi:hypothetical protein
MIKATLSPKSFAGGSQGLASNAGGILVGTSGWSACRQRYHSVLAPLPFSGAHVGLLHFSWRDGKLYPLVEQAK